MLSRRSADLSLFHASPSQSLRLNLSHALTISISLTPRSHHLLSRRLTISLHLAVSTVSPLLRTIRVAIISLSRARRRRSSPQPRSRRLALLILPSRIALSSSSRVSRSRSPSCAGAVRLLPPSSSSSRRSNGDACVFRFLYFVIAVLSA
ncbi:hypothetical protein Scep_016981 [Stephania cephalantha]|uniref:Uncharacterized protein n=1 Tax=Stephania cephalantha TaxID=152367 RepID=A0AAP0INQ2_9MAGN